MREMMGKGWDFKCLEGLGDRFIPKTWSGKELGWVESVVLMSKVFCSEGM